MVVQESPQDRETPPDSSLPSCSTIHVFFLDADLFRVLSLKGCHFRRFLTFVPARHRDFLPISLPRAPDLTRCIHSPVNVDVPLCQYPHFSCELPTVEFSLVPLRYFFPVSECPLLCNNGPTALPCFSTPRSTPDVLYFLPIRSAPGPLPQKQYTVRFPHAKPTNMLVVEWSYRTVL